MLCAADSVLLSVTNDLRQGVAWASHAWHVAAVQAADDFCCEAQLPRVSVVQGGC